MDLIQLFLRKALFQELFPGDPHLCPASDHSEICKRSLKDRSCTGGISQMASCHHYIVGIFIGRDPVGQGIKLSKDPLICHGKSFLRHKFLPVIHDCYMKAQHPADLCYRKRNMAATQYDQPGILLVGFHKYLPVSVFHNAGFHGCFHGSLQEFFCFFISFCSLRIKKASFFRKIFQPGILSVQKDPCFYTPSFFYHIIYCLIHSLCPFCPSFAVYSAASSFTAPTAVSTSSSVLK